MHLQRACNAESEELLPEIGRIVNLSGEPAVAKGC